MNRLQTIDADTLQSTAYEHRQIVAGAVAVSLRRAGQATLDVRHAAMRGAVPLSGGQLPAYPEPPL